MGFVCHERGDIGMWRAMIGGLLWCGIYIIHLGAKDYSEIMKMGMRGEGE